MPDRDNDNYEDLEVDLREKGLIKDFDVKFIMEVNGKVIKELVYPNMYFVTEDNPLAFAESLTRKHLETLQIKFSEALTNHINGEIKK
jgi:uncharacterized membrane protein YcaP (DUF421 family)